MAVGTSPVETRELYGGAMVCTLPVRLKDVSDMRPVPDHQEVWADPDLDQALIFEVVEHDASVINADVGRHVFEDAAVGNEAASASVAGVRPLAAAEVPSLPEGGYACLVSGSMTVRRGQDTQDTAVLLAVLRMPHVASDLLLTLSTPAAAPAPAQAEAEGVMSAALRSLEIRDWGLFGG
ncbi:hypothetical protein HYH03_005955 [Edaphochlamys debaryana]|uniref:Ran guanine nucleotide release factor n=1 Tax=Edaphochlamys debaryana TaxID=47281 RepID=A0A836C1W3_9CHLO|nr:hypothetical protein HYH03_005955 [Edaphochlamys debaryana]|eukprot:KAG2496033.1 hypothetical protein HYH03_005955 [Edaphochlamys debaryana]